MKKVLICIIVFILIAVLGVGIFNFTNIDENIRCTILKKFISKEELKDISQTFFIQFTSSNPSLIRVEYDFKAQTKIIKYYYNNSVLPQEIPYSRFDELFDFLYETVLQDTNPQSYSLLNNFGSVYAGQEPYYDMFLNFNISKKLPTYSSNWFSSYDYTTNTSSWILNGFQFPVYWNEFLEILEIDESILGEGITYDFYNSIYE